MKMNVFHFYVSLSIMNIGFGETEDMTSELVIPITNTDHHVAYNNFNGIV